MEKDSFGEGDEEYDLLVAANEVIVDITHDITDIHKVV